MIPPLLFIRFCYFILFASTETYGLLEQMLKKDIWKISNNVPFNFTNFLFESVNEITNNDITYYLFTRKYKNVTVTRSLELINKKHPIKMLVHGWTEHVNAQWYKDMTNAYLKRGFYNIILIDWSTKGDTDYLSASRNSRSVGIKIGEFLVNLCRKKEIPFERIHLIAHSLGSHVSGFIGKKVYEMTGKKLGRITALDPAAPIFDMAQSDEFRLSKNDAKFVDVIHTDGGMLGFKYPIGTVDFFPNGGSAIQPGCSLLKLNITFDDFTRAHKINKSKKFYARPCSSWENFARGMCRYSKSLLFGENVNMNVVGSYYLQTKNEDIIL